MPGNTDRDDEGLGQVSHCDFLCYSLNSILGAKMNLYKSLKDCFGGMRKKLNFIPLWEWMWCHCVFHARQDLTQTLVSDRWGKYTGEVQKGAVEMLAHRWRHIMTSHLFLKWDRVYAMKSNPLIRNSILKGNSTPNQIWACFVPYLKMISIFFKHPETYCLRNSKMALQFQ